MIWRNTNDAYGNVAKSFHWVVALLMIGVLALGLYMGEMKMGPSMFKMYALHKSLGITILLLATLRLLWRLTGVHPLPLPNHQPWEKLLAKLTHGLLYVALFAMPLSGWIMSSGKGFSVSFFGLFTLPDLIGPDKDIAKFANEFHEITAWTVMALIGLHAAGALKHHVIDRDDTLRRMLPGCCKKAALLVALLVSLSAPALAQNNVPSWTIKKDASTISFTGTQMGAPFTGTFKDFDGTIAFDPANLFASKADITIHLASVDATSPDRTSYLPQPAWFDTAKFPDAKFVTTSIEKGADATHFTAKGNLTLRGITLPVTLPFLLVITDTTATMSGETTISRLDFGIGQGEWKDTETVGADVKIAINVIAVKTP